MAKGSQKTKRQILGVISAARAESFLRELANLRDEQSGIMDAAAVTRLKARFPEMGEPFGEQRAAWESFLIMGREYLRRAWTEQDYRQREWYLFALRKQYRDEVIQASYREGRAVPPPELSPDEVKRAPENFHPAIPPGATLVIDKVEHVDERKVEAPPLTPFEATAFHMQHNLNRALHCPHPTCAAPYFFRKKKNQKFCSPECAQPSIGESKRRWWAENKSRRPS